MNSKSAGNIVEKGRSDNMDSNLSESDRKTLITLAHEFLVGKCAKIERAHIITVAKLLVFLVPKLKDATKGEHAGYVSCFEFDSNLISVL